MVLTKIKRILGRSGVLAIVAVYALLLVAGDVLLLQAPKASAAEITSRSLSLSSSANGSINTDVAGNAAAAGSGGNGEKAKHTVTFTMATSGATVGSIALIYCDNPIPATTCTSSAAATGDESNLTSASVSGSGGGTLGSSGWSLDTSTTDPTITGYGTCNGGGTVRSNCVLLTSSSPAANTNTPTITITYGGGGSDYVTNPTNDNQTFYVRIVTFSDTAYTVGNVVDHGSVASSTAQQIDITAKVQEELNFSAGTTITAPGSACTPYSDTGALNLGDVNGILSFTTAYDAYSYFRVSTNATVGTSVDYSGNTLDSGGTNIAAAGTTAASSTVGSEQFGLGLDSSDASYSFTTLAPTAQYGSGNGTITNGGTAKFAFDTSSVTTPVAVATASAAITCDTGSVRYIGNIASNTPAGVYTTTITYLAVPTY
jgi:hypothetical protein